MTVIYLALSYSIIIYTFLNTNVLIEYYQLFKLNGWNSLIDKYIQNNKDGYIENFPEFLAKRDKFFTNLITCPICLSIWVGIISFILVGFKFLCVSYLTLLFYYILKWFSNNQNKSK